MPSVPKAPTYEEQLVPFSIRFTRPMLDQLYLAAAAEHRSLGSFIRHILAAKLSELNSEKKGSS